MIFSLLVVAGLAAGSECQSVNGDRIYGADLTRALPSLSGIPDDAVIGFAPQPGSVRRFRADEIARIALRQGVSAASVTGLCFAWKMAPVSEVAAADAMRRAFGDTLLAIDVKAMQPVLAPSGELVFPREGLGASRKGQPADWRGYIRYAPGKKFAVTARVVVTARVNRVIASDPLKPGLPIPTESIRFEQVDEAPGRPAGPAAVADVAGWLPRRAIPAGSAILSSDLLRPLDIVRNGLVQVEVRTPSARLLVEARAEAGGRPGDVIPLRNLVSGKRFLAVVEGRNVASISFKGGLR